MNQLQLAIQMLNSNAYRYTGLSMFDVPSEGYYAIIDAMDDILAVAAIDTFGAICRAAAPAAPKTAKAEPTLAQLAIIRAAQTDDVIGQATGDKADLEALEDMGYLRHYNQQNKGRGPVVATYWYITAKGEDLDTSAVADQPQPSPEVDAVLVVPNGSISASNTPGCPPDCNGSSVTTPTTPAAKVRLTKLSKTQRKALEMLAVKSCEGSDVFTSKCIPGGTAKSLVRMGFAEIRDFDKYHFPPLYTITDAGRAALNGR
jgi:hypothetical protein